MKKRILQKVTLVSILGTMMISNTVFAAGKLPKGIGRTDVGIRVDGQLQTIPEDMGKAYVDAKTSRTMVPVRFVSEKLGHTVNYIEKGSKYKDGAVVIGSGKNLVLLEINSNKYSISDNNGIRNGSLDVSSQVYDGRTYVPIRFLSETTGYNVDWKNNEVIINRGLEKPDVNPNTTKASEVENNKKEEKINTPKWVKKEDRANKDKFGIEFRRSFQEEFKVDLNNYRVSMGLNPVIESESLNEIAKERVREELNGYVKGIKPDHVSDKNLNENLGENLMRYKGWIEYKGKDFDGWRSSPGHNENMLDENAYEYGYAKGIKDVNGTKYIVSIYVFQ
ncbi:SCP-like protein [Aedoeadaptatus coxii]|uniref:SCP-like protein n=1 Tax=Aedoeadaptatus coxii TaxID=755172 RepID=A0A134AD63_9FIRM|nr:stalk domain-containing protein [Peptoniphilus coxii]KXB65641.1 SCP-like protein [Peptoniphilus coxii]